MHLGGRTQCGRISVHTFQHIEYGNGVVGRPQQPSTFCCDISRQIDEAKRHSAQQCKPACGDLLIFFHLNQIQYFVFRGFLDQDPRECFRVPACSWCRGAPSGKESTRVSWWGEKQESMMS